MTDRGREPSPYRTTIEHRRIGGHEAFVIKSFSGTGTHGGKSFQARCSCGWVSEDTFDRQGRDRAIEQRDAHFEEKA